MKFSPVPSYPAETEWSELRLTKCAQRAASSLQAKVPWPLTADEKRPADAGLVDFCLITAGRWSGI